MKFVYTAVGALISKVSAFAPYHNMPYHTIMSVRFISKVANLIKNTNANATVNSIASKSVISASSSSTSKVSLKPAAPKNAASVSKATSSTSASASATNTITSANTTASFPSIPIHQTVFAATAGIATVAVTAMTAENVTASSDPNFEPTA